MGDETLGSYRLILTTIAPPETNDFLVTNVSWLLDTRKGTIENKSIRISSCVQRSNDERRRGVEGHPPCFRRYDRELVLKPAISSKKVGGATVVRL